MACLVPPRLQVLGPCLYQACRRCTILLQGPPGTGSGVLPDGSKCHFNGLQVHPESQPWHSRGGAKVMSTSLYPSVMEWQEAHSSLSCGPGMGQETITYCEALTV